MNEDGIHEGGGRGSEIHRISHYDPFVPCIYLESVRKDHEIHFYILCFLVYYFCRVSRLLFDCPACNFGKYSSYDFRLPYIFCFLFTHVFTAVELLKQSF